MTFTSCISYTPETWSKLLPEPPEDRRDDAYVVEWEAPTAFGMASANTMPTRSSRRLTTSRWLAWCFAYHGRRRPNSATVLMSVEELVEGRRQRILATAAGRVARNPDSEGLPHCLYS